MTDEKNPPPVDVGTGLLPGVNDNMLGGSFRQQAHLSTEPPARSRAGTVAAVLTSFLVVGGVVVYLL